MVEGIKKYFAEKGDNKKENLVSPSEAPTTPESAPSQQSPKVPEVKVAVGVQVASPSQPTQPTELAAPGGQPQKISQKPTSEKQVRAEKKVPKKSPTPTPKTSKRGRPPKATVKQVTTTDQPIKPLATELTEIVNVTQKNKEKMLKEPALKFAELCKRAYKQLGNDFSQILSSIVKKIKDINANILSVSAEIQQAQKDAEKKFDDLLKELDEAKKILQ